MIKNTKSVRVYGKKTITHNYHAKNSKGNKLRYWRVEINNKSFIIPMNDVFRCRKMLCKEKVNIYPWRDWMPNNPELFCILFDVENFRDWESNGVLKEDITNFIQGLKDVSFYFNRN